MVGEGGSPYSHTSNTGPRLLSLAATAQKYKAPCDSRPTDQQQYETHKFPGEEREINTSLWQAIPSINSIISYNKAQKQAHTNKYLPTLPEVFFPMNTFAYLLQKKLLLF